MKRTPVNFATLAFTNAADVDVRGTGGGSIKIDAQNLSLEAGKFGSSFILGGIDADSREVRAGDININVAENMILDDSGISSQVSGAGNSGNIDINTNSLKLTNGGAIDASTFGQGNAGEVNINATEDITADGEDSEGFLSGITSQVNPGAEGDSGGITILTTNLNLTAGGRVDSSTRGTGNAGILNITVTGDTTADGENSRGFPSGITSGVNIDAVGDAKGITIFTNNLKLTNGGRIVSPTIGQGNAGATNITATGNIIIDGENSKGFSSIISSGVNTSATGDAGDVIISTTDLELTNGGRVSSSTRGQGNAGKLKITANSINLDRESSIATASESNFDAGDITLDVGDFLQATNSFISTSSTQSSGGNLTITAGDIQLRGNSDITTDIASGEGSRGNISIKADSIIAFDDSDIFAFAQDGQGGNINLDTPAFFAENFTLNSLTANPEENDLDSNARADVNATGAVSSGAVDIPDVSFIKNSLTELPDNSINTDELVANSCVVPVGDRSQGKFIITGGESLPVRPGNNLPSKYPTGEVRGVTEENTSSWQPGDPIVEAQDAYRLANGKWVLSRECSQ